MEGGDSRVVTVEAEEPRAGGKADVAVISSGTLHTSSQARLPSRGLTGSPTGELVAARRGAASPQRRSGV